MSLVGGAASGSGSTDNGGSASVAGGSATAGVGGSVSVTSGGSTSANSGTFEAGSAGSAGERLGASGSVSWMASALVAPHMAGNTGIWWKRRHVGSGQVHRWWIGRHSDRKQSHLVAPTHRRIRWQWHFNHRHGGDAVIGIIIWLCVSAQVHRRMVQAAALCAAESARRHRRKAVSVQVATVDTVGS